MKQVGIIGSGAVAKALGNGFIKHAKFPRPGKAEGLD